MSGKERGATKLGQKVFGDNITIRSDIGNQILRQTPVGPDGLAARADHLDRKGRRQEPVLRSLLGEEAGQAVHADRARSRAW